MTRSLYSSTLSKEVWKINHSSILYLLCSKFLICSLIIGQESMSKIVIKSEVCVQMSYGMWWLHTFSASVYTFCTISLNYGSCFMHCKHLCDLSLLRLMFVNVSPLPESLQETLCSLRFATKVCTHNYLHMSTLLSLLIFVHQILGQSMQHWHCKKDSKITPCIISNFILNFM